MGERGDGRLLLSDSEIHHIRLLLRMSPSYFSPTE